MALPLRWRIRRPARPWLRPWTKGDGQDAAVPSKSDAFADKLTALSQALSTPAATARPVTATVPGQPLSPQAGNFSEAVVDKVMWMSSQNLKTADIQMEPAQLGKLEVRIDMTQDQTQVTFASPHADVREALDNGSQRLRELFAQAGHEPRQRQCFRSVVRSGLAAVAAGWPER